MALLFGQAAVPLRSYAQGAAPSAGGRTAGHGRLHPSKGARWGADIVSHPLKVFVQFVVDSTVTDLDGGIVRKLATGELEVSAALAVRLAAYARNAARLIVVRTLGNIRERLAYDLLERACRTQLMVGRLEVKATQSDLADSIGSAREVVSRALNTLRADGIVETTPGIIRVILPMRLAAIVRAFVI